MFVEINDQRIPQWIKEGKVFIYPTDTIYGIGCNADNEFSVKRIRKIKISNKPFSVIAPSKEWIKENCECGEELEKLPGPYTFIYKTKYKSEVNKGIETLGVRIPDHEFSQYVKKVGVAFVTTSVNQSGEEAISSIKDIPADILGKVDIIIDVGEIKGKASKIIDYSQSEKKVIRV